VLDDAQASLTPEDVAAEDERGRALTLDMASDLLLQLLG
jgi:hypothetical protein